MTQDAGLRGINLTNLFGYYLIGVGNQVQPFRNWRKKWKFRNAMEMDIS